MDTYINYNGEKSCTKCYRLLFDDKCKRCFPDKLEVESDLEVDMEEKGKTWEDYIKTQTQQG